MKKAAVVRFVGNQNEYKLGCDKSAYRYCHDRLLENSPGEIMQIAASIAWQHHELFDGKGYQNKLEGEHINICQVCSGSRYF